MAKNEDFETSTGKGGETHQHVPKKGPHSKPDAHLTTNQGIRVSDNQNSLRAGARGPTLLEDFVLREKIFHFDHERIPERIVHARGSAAHGYFENYKSLADITKADLFQRAGEKTPLFTRISTVAGGAGSVDTPRDVRGFAVKFYTKEGNWDLVGNNIPVFFIQDAIKFPDLIHAVKMESDRAFPQAGSAHDTFWDWASLMPESTHMLMWAMSDRAIPRSLRMIEGFGIHTFQMVNAKGKVTFVKFHWKPKLGLQSTLWDEALKLQAADNDFHRRDLWESINSGNFPEWEFGIQAFDQKFADKLPYDVLDATKLIPEEVLPIRIVGRMVLDRNPDNFFAETEQVAYCPANIVPGLDFTNDPLLQGRLFSYFDTQKSRLGTANFHQLPINAPKCPVMNFQRDGQMQMNVPKGRANYEPNSLSLHGEEGGARADLLGCHHRLCRRLVSAGHAVLGDIPLGGHRGPGDTRPVAVPVGDLAGACAGNCRGFRIARASGHAGHHRADAGAAVALDAVRRMRAGAARSDHPHARAGLFEPAAGRRDGRAAAAVGQHHGRLAADRRNGGREHPVVRRRLCRLPTAGGEGVASATVLLMPELAR